MGVNYLTTRTGQQKRAERIRVLASYVSAQYVHEWLGAARQALLGLQAELSHLRLGLEL